MSNSPAPLLLLTAYNRPEYFKKTVESWAQVKQKEQWDLVISLDYTPDDTIRQQMLDIAHSLDNSGFRRVKIDKMEKNLGVLEHPYAAFTKYFNKGADFIVRAEDDLIVSDDILHYFMANQQTFKSDYSIASIHGCTFEQESLGSEYVSKSSRFNPLVFGTWRDRWDAYIGPTWDRDYSTYNGTVGNQAGWDWNLNTRVLPKLGKSVLLPHTSRVDNIGVYGTHALPSNFVKAPTFSHSNPLQTFILR